MRRDLSGSATAAPHSEAAPQRNRQQRATRLPHRIDAPLGRDGRLVGWASLRLPDGPKKNADLRAAATDRGGDLRRREALLLFTGVSATSFGAAGISQAEGYKCRGLRGRELQICLREARGEGGGESGDSRDEAFLKNRQYEQPGELVVTTEGVQYREIEKGNPAGVACDLGRICEVRERALPPPPAPARNRGMCTAGPP